MGLSEDLFKVTSKVSSIEFNPIIKILIADISKINAHVRVYIFGSVARDEATSDSDLDILFVVPDGASLKDIRAQFYKTKTFLDVNVDIVFKTEAQFKLMDTLFLDGISADLKEVYPEWKLNQDGK